MTGQPQNPNPGPAAIPDAARDALGLGMGLAGAVPGGGWAVQSALGAGGEKKIAWDGSAWRCDDLRIRLKRFVNGVAQTVDFSPQSLTIVDDRGWLVPGEAIKEGDAWRIPLAIRDGAVVAPPVAGGPPNFGTANANARPQPPGSHVQIKVTVTAEIDMNSIAFATAAAGMIPGGAGVIAAGLPPITLTSSIPYHVVPPRVSWSLDQEQPIPLAGAGGLMGLDYANPGDGGYAEVIGAGSVVTLVSGELPPGWLGGATVGCTVTRKSAMLGATVVGLSPKTVTDTSIVATAQISTSRLILHPVAEMAHDRDTVNAQIVVRVVTSGAYLGTQIQDLSCDAQALDVCWYFKNVPAARFEWTNATRLRIKPPTRLENPPVSSRMKFDLRFLIGWSPPPVRYSKPEDDLDDLVLAPESPMTEYRAPGRNSWRANGSPTRRSITCMLGTGDETVPVPEHHDLDLFYSVRLEAPIELQPIRKAHVVVRIGPSDLMAEAGANKGLDLANPGILDAILRTFHLHFDAIE